MKRSKTPMKMKEHEIYCPYCGARARLVKAADVYGEKAIRPDEWMYVCGNRERTGCDAYVTCYRGTKKPMGTMADGELRNARIKAHQTMSVITEEKRCMTKGELYKYLSVKLSFLCGRHFHVGESNLYNCTEAIKVMDGIIATYA